MLDQLTELVRRGGKAAWRLMSSPLVPDDVRKTIEKGSTFEAARESWAALARKQQADLHRLKEAAGRVNNATEYKATNGLGEPVLTNIPMEIAVQMQSLHGPRCWSDPEFIAAFWRDNPAFRARVTRGTRGQEYGGTRSLRDFSFTNFGSGHGAAGDPSPPFSAEVSTAFPAALSGHETPAAGALPQ